MTADPLLESFGKALEMAHAASLSSSDEARDGIESAEVAAARALLAKSQDAVRSWANWEAINEVLASKEAQAAIDWAELYAIADVRKALARDAVLRAFGLSDPVRGGDRITLCRFAELLEQHGMPERLSSVEWALTLGHKPSVADWAVRENRKRLARLRSLIVSDWTSNEPADRELINLRKLVRPTRNHLAHGLSWEIADRSPTIDQIRRFIGLTHELAVDVAFLWIGSAVDTASFAQFAKEQAEKLWQSAFRDAMERQADQQRELVLRSHASLRINP